jgi:hypothetical protein
VVERVAVVKLRMNQGCSDGAGSIEVQGCEYASEVTDMIIASGRLCQRQSRDQVE